MFGSVVRGRRRVWCLGGADGPMICGRVGGVGGSSALVVVVGCLWTVVDLGRLCTVGVGRDLARRRIQRSR
jgi:hypothetical protein